MKKFKEYVVEESSDVTNKSGANVSTDIPKPLLKMKRKNKKKCRDKKESGS